MFIGFNISVIEYIFLFLCLKRFWIAHNFAKNVYSTRSEY
nr:MAG TPA: hypothetical protein [Caudoviricetes sp.]